MNIDIVIARYNENLEWTKQFPNVIIYNKGKKLDGEYNEIFLDNVGKEGHTYYKHICDNYDNLSDYTIFLQGNPFDHSPNIIAVLHKLINENLFCNTYQIYKYFNEKDYSIFHNNNYEKHLNQLEFDFLSKDLHFTTINLDKSRIYNCDKLDDTFKNIFNVECNHDDVLEFGAGAQFIVSKNKILSKPKEFYENIVKILEYTINPNEGYDIERLHKYIFN